MKNICFALLLLCGNLCAQDYHKKWEKVLELESQGKIKSADDAVSKILRKAERHDNGPQLVKCFFYRSKYLFTLEEGAAYTILGQLRSEINTAKSPVRSLFSLIYAKSLTDFRNRNMHKLANVSTDSLANEDIRLWSVKNFDDEIERAYAQSLKDSANLKKIKASEYEQVFDYLSKEKFASETLLDYVITVNLEYRCADLDDRYWFEIGTRAHLMSDPRNFVNANFDTIADVNRRTILKLFQQREKNNPETSNVLARIVWLFPESSRLEALKRLRVSARDTIEKNDVRYQLATAYLALADKVNNPDYLTKSMELLDSIVKTGKRSNSYLTAIQARKGIAQKSVSAQFGQFVYDGENTRAQISYKNIDTLNIRIYKVAAKAQFLPFYNYNYKTDLKAMVFLGKLRPHVEKSYFLRNSGDHFDHTTEILIPNLEIGTYIFEFRANDFNSDQNAYSLFTVSNIALLKLDRGPEVAYSAVNRKSGNHLKGLSVSLISREESLKTDAGGTVRIKGVANGEELSGYAISGRDSLAFYHRSYQYQQPAYVTLSKAQLFLDRAIYRPGQTVYFKAIVSRRDSSGVSVVPRIRISVNAYDVNGKAVFDKILETNEFGSISGEFQLPKDGLTGTYQLELQRPASLELTESESVFWSNGYFDSSEQTFQVEEYKRPKFEVGFEKAKSSFRLDTQAEIYGYAKALLGSNISGAIVKYTVTLAEIKYNTDSAVSGRFFRERDEIDEIVLEDSTRTDENGKFRINFPAEHRNEENGKMPVYRYTIKADVTDLNGETRTSETFLNIGRHALELGLEGELSKANNNKIQLRSRDLNGEFKGVSGEVRFRRIKNPIAKFKFYAYPKPEIPGFTADEFKRLFPNEPVEEDRLTGVDSAVVMTIPVNTSRKTEITANLTQLEAGDYELIFTATDEWGNAIEHREIRTLRDPKALFDASKLLTITILNAHPEKDRFALVNVSSPVRDLDLRLLANHGSTIFFEKAIKLVDHSAVVKIPISNTHRYGIGISADAIFDNYFAIDEKIVHIPEPIRELQLETVSYRNLIEPGSKQTWAFRLKARNTPLASEILASMYDLSLDAFTTAEWNPPNMQPRHYPNAILRQLDHRIDDWVYLFNHYYGSAPVWRPEETQMIWFGFNINNDRSGYLQKLYKDQVSRKALKPQDSRKVSGYVADATGVLPGVSVRVKGTPRGVQSDVDGYYEIEVAEGEVLEFSFVGMEDQSHVVSSEQQLDILLKDGGIELGEVVVSGAMSIQRKDNLKEYEEDISAMTLVGRVSGVQINTGNNEKTKIVLRGNRTNTGDGSALIVVDGKVVSQAAFEAMNASDIAGVEVVKGAQGAALYGQQGANGVIVVTTKKTISAMAQIKARTNFSETAFFLPHLKTDEEGGISFSFTSPEALTSWKLRLLAHNKEAVPTQMQQTVATQKTLMVVPNFPRFFREKDSIVISAKLTSMGPKPLTGTVMLELSDAATMENADQKCANFSKVKAFSLAPSGNTVVRWKIYIPAGLSGLHYRLVAQADGFSDGEENIVPVLANSMLVTESKPIWVSGHSKKTVELENLRTNVSKTLRHHKMTVEFTSNPVWLALQSLPYLMEFEHECSEQLFARFYANAIATHVIESNPKIADVIKKWSKNGKARLSQNEDLKSALINETPWFRDALSEDEKKQRLATLLDLAKMRESQSAVVRKLEQKQRVSGGFPWFDGPYTNRYITRHIAAGLGHLKKLGIGKNDGNATDGIATKAISFLDGDFLKYKSDITLQRTPSYFREDLHYLYARSFYLNEIPMDKDLSGHVAKTLQRIASDRFQLSVFEKAMATLVLHRFGKEKEALELLDNLKETSATDETIGMHWVENRNSWYWYQAPVETQALLIEAFSEVTDDVKSIDAMKAWLIKNKQTSNWHTTKSTTEAIYALLLKGSDWVNVKDDITFRIGDEKIRSRKLSETQKDAGTGYVKMNWNAGEISPDMATLQIENKTSVPAFGGFYWQFFEDLDAIRKSEAGPMSVSQELFRKVNTADGVHFDKVTDGLSLKIGETLTIRITVKIAEDLEYVHLKSMRASCFEPLDVLSGYQSGMNVWFYKSTKDLATHYFFDRLAQGSYQLEYEVRVNNAGDFSNGITTIQSMYAPEFSAHSKGIRVTTK